MRTSTTLLVIAALTATIAPAQDQDPAIAGAVLLQDAFAKVADKVFPSVVCVTTWIPDPEAKAAGGAKEWVQGGQQENRYPGFKKYTGGSGLMVDKEGHVLCSRHILVQKDGAMAPVIEVETQDGRRTLSRIVGSEPTLNIGVLKLDVFPQGRPPQFTVATIGDPHAVKVGHWVLAVGDPSGPERTFTAGILAAQPRRQCYQGEITSTFLQAALTVHPEAAGGPLVDIHGRVVGLLTPRQSEAGVAIPGVRGLEYAMPMEIVMNIFEALKKKGSNVSPWLGFSVLEIAALRNRLRKTNPAALRSLKAPVTGVYIDDLFDPGPGKTAGIRPGDFLVSMDGHRLFSVLDFQKWLYLSGVGKKVKLEIFRAGETRMIEVLIEKRPKDAITR